MNSRIKLPIQVDGKECNATVNTDQINYYRPFFIDGKTKKTSLYLSGSTKALLIQLTPEEFEEKLSNHNKEKKST